jgi:uncharacterized phiE125 gp8 family phage protein
MNLIQTEAPSSEPLSLAEVTTHLRLGPENLEPVPSAPIIALAGVGAGNVDNGVHRYRLTFVTADGETDGGDVSAIVTVADKTVNGKVSLTAIPVGGTAVTARKIYRTVAGGSVYLLLTTLNDNATVVYVDNIADAALGAAVPSVNTTRDPELRRWIKLAREDAEGYLRRALITQTWELRLECFPGCNEIKLPKPPLQEVDKVEYRDETGEYVTLADTEYDVDFGQTPGRIILKYNRVWPFTYPVWDAVKVTFICGYGDTGASVPELFRQGMKLLISDYSENRETQNIGNIVNALPGIKRCFRDRYLEVQ